VEIWQGSSIIRAAQKESHAHNAEMSAVDSISDTEEIFNASWTNLLYISAAALTLSERSPLPPGRCAKNILGGQTKILNVRPIKKLDQHRPESDDNSSPEVISDIEYWIDWNGDLDNSYVKKDDGLGDN
jgi:hypothetical protein